MADGHVWGLVATWPCILGAYVAPRPGTFWEDLGAGAGPLSHLFPRPLPGSWEGHHIRVCESVCVSALVSTGVRVCLGHGDHRPCFPSLVVLLFPNAELVSV